MITERILKKWRKEALISIKNTEKLPEGQSLILKEPYEQVLQMTQELLDQYLIRRNK